MKTVRDYTLLQLVHRPSHLWFKILCGVPDAVVDFLFTRMAYFRITLTHFLVLFGTSFDRFLQKAVSWGSWLTSQSTRYALEFECHSNRWPFARLNSFPIKFRIKSTVLVGKYIQFWCTGFHFPGSFIFHLVFNLFNKLCQIMFFSKRCSKIV